MAIVEVEIRGLDKVINSMLDGDGIGLCRIPKGSTLKSIKNKDGKVIATYDENTPSETGFSIGCWADIPDEDTKVVTVTASALKAEQ